MLTFLQPGANPSDTSQTCPLCGSGQPASERYPDYVCAACVAHAVDEYGNALTFRNSGFSGGLNVWRTATNEKIELDHFLIGTTKCVVHEARFGGFVVQAAIPQARTE